MPPWLKPVAFAHIILEPLDLIDPELNNLAAYITEKMVVMFGAECFFVVVTSIGLPYFFDKTE